jgi:hypothetical protein
VRNLLFCFLSLAGLDLNNSVQGLKIELTRLPELVLLTAGLPIWCNEMGYYGKCKSISAAVESAVPMSQITTIKNYTILTYIPGIYIYIQSNLYYIILLIRSK